MSPRSPRIVIGVTIDDSLQFHTGLPAALVEDGWDVHVVAGPGRRIDALAQQPGVTVHVLPMRRGPSPVRDIAALIRWITLLRRIRPDVTLIGTPKAALLGHLAGRWVGVPHRIYNLLGLRVETATGPLRVVLTSMERATSANASQVLAVGESVRVKAIELGLVPRGKISVLGRGSCNGVDVDFFGRLADDRDRIRSLRAEQGLDRDVPVIGFVGRLTRDKGLPELASALRTLADRSVRVQLLVVGGVDDSTGQAALRDLRATGQRVVAAGYQPDPSPFYPLMDAFCLPSLREGLPNVILEAMASRTVVVASDATGNVDLVVNGETGFLAKMGSSTSLANAIERALSAGHEEVTRRARDFVAANFEVTQVQGLIRAFLLASLDDPS